MARQFDDIRNSFTIIDRGGTSDPDMMLKLFLLGFDDFYDESNKTAVAERFCESFDLGFSAQELISYLDGFKAAIVKDLEKESYTDSIEMVFAQKYLDELIILNTSNFSEVQKESIINFFKKVFDFWSDWDYQDNRIR